MALKYDLNYMQKLFKSKGYELLNKEYKRLKDNAEFICLKHSLLNLIVKSIYFFE